MATPGVNAVERALSIVESFRTNSDRLTLRAIAEKTGLNKGTIIRLIASLEKFGYVLRVGPGEYALGPAFIEYGNLYRDSFQFSDHALPIMRDLVKESGESAGLFVRDGKMRICLHKVGSAGSLVSSLREGDRRSILPGGTGKIMLAFSDNPSEQETWPEIRADHYIINIGDRHPEFSSLAAPIFERGQTLAAVLSLSGPTSRFTEVRIEENLPRLLNAAAALTKRVGGDPKPIENQIDIMANL
jgi:DNA-binding IclR family transcriptional regulator